MHRRRLPLVAAILVVLAGSLRAQVPDARSTLSWAYQLDNIEPHSLSASGFDLLVIDHSRDGTLGGIFAAEEVAAMRTRPNGPQRIILSYMSIGEAEDYRFYWRRAWLDAPPPWLDAENPDWPGNYKVRYWEEDWQALIFGSATAYLDRILNAGFDGVYLDIIDAFEYYEDTRPGAEAEMVRFVRELSAYAKSVRPGFLIVPQNGERLLSHPDYLRAIDGIAKEDLYWGYDGRDAPTPSEETTYSRNFLELARDAGKLVITVDYPSDLGQAPSIYAQARADGFVPYVTIRDLDLLTVNEGLDPESGGVQRPATTTRQLPGQFFALTAPKGTVRLNLVADFWSETASYTGDDFGVDGATTAFESEDFHEWTYALKAGYGVSDHVEFGVVLPLVQGRFERAANDGLSTVPRSFDELGLGNVRAYLAASESWNDDNTNLLGILEYAAPSDTRDDPFGGGNGEILISATGEHYRGVVGVIGQIGTTIFLEEEGAESNAVFEVGLGVGIELSERLFLSVMALREDSVLRPEVAAELLVGDGKSIEVFFARDANGRPKATSAGVALNLWLRH